MKSENIAMRVSFVSIVINVLLSLMKLVAGILGKSGAMISDAVHSASDVISTVVVIIGVKLAGKSADEDHPYGHERMESAAAIILAMMLAVVGFGIGSSGVSKIVEGNYSDLTVPSVIPLFAAILSIASKEWMFHYTKFAAKKINSGALMADAWHHRSDALSSVGSFAGILFARIGFPIMDSVASVVISVFIVKAAYDIFKDGLDKMVDHSCDAETEKKILDSTLSVSGVEKVDDLKTRLFGDKIYVDMEIAVNRDLTIAQAHEIAEAVHKEIEKDFPVCKHCMVHVNPSEK
jgi:cation diffusion facilitator family transporter